MSRQATQLSYASPDVEVEARIAVADRLVTLSERPFTGVVLASGGGEAVELAIAIARRCTGRSWVISFRGCYHGCGSLSGLLGAEFDEPVDALRQIARKRHRIMQCALARSSCDVKPTVKTIRERLSHLPEAPAAIIVEPIVGVNGFYVLPREFLQVLRKFASAMDAVLIFDEVLTGFWRTGKCFAFQGLDCIPDAVCFGKAVTSGYIPLSGVLLSDKWRIRLAKNPLTWGTTNFAHPIACAAALCVLAELSGPTIQRRLLGLAPVAWDLAYQLAKRMPDIITEVRGAGLLLALQLSQSLAGDDRGLRVATMLRIRSLLYEHGLLAEIDPAIGVIPIAPPFVIDEDHLRLAFRAIETSLKDIAVENSVRRENRTRKRYQSTSGVMPS